MEGNDDADVEFVVELARIVVADRVGRFEVKEAALVASVDVWVVLGNAEVRVVNVDRSVVVAVVAAVVAIGAAVVVVALLVAVVVVVVVVVVVAVVVVAAAVVLVALVAGSKTTSTR